jgi:hypothetical protein
MEGGVPWVRSPHPPIVLARLNAQKPAAQIRDFIVSLLARRAQVIAVNTLAQRFAAVAE